MAAWRKLGIIAGGGELPVVLSEHCAALGRPAFPVDVVDPTGAGDCFCGTFVTLLAGGMDVTGALGRAVAAGALAVTALGPMEGNSDLAQVERFMAG